jgi:hypothetical protein
MPVMQPQSASFLTCLFLPSPTNLNLIPCIPSFTLSPSQTEPRAEEDVEPRDWIGLDGKQAGTRSGGGGGGARSCSGGARAEACDLAELANPRRPSFCARGPSFIPATAPSAPSRVAAKTVPRQTAKSIPAKAARFLGAPPHPLPPPRRRRPLRGRLRP